MGALTLWQYLRDFGERRLSRLVFIDQSPRLLTGEGWQGGIYGDFGPERSAAFMAELRQDFAEAVLRLVAFGHNPRARDLYQENAKGIQLARERLRTLDPQPLIDCWASLTAADYRDVLTVGAVGTFTVGWLLPRLEDFQARHPFIDLRLSTHNNRVDIAAEGYDLAEGVIWDDRAGLVRACERLPGEGAQQHG